MGISALLCVSCILLLYIIGGDHRCHRVPEGGSGNEESEAS